MLSRSELIVPPSPAAIPAASGKSAASSGFSSVSGASSTPNGPRRDEAIQFLKGEDNPFDVFVAAQELADDFAECHIPEIHAAVREQLLLAIDKYRRPEYRVRQDLHPSRALVVRGPRGAGKTHLLHTLLARADAPELIIQPRYFEKQYAFPEYLLRELVQSLLLDSSDWARSRFSPVASPLPWVARQLTCRLLAQAVRALDPAQWLDWTGRTHGWGVLAGWSWKHTRQQQAALAERLESFGTQESLNQACLQHGLTTETALALVQCHVERNDAGSGTLAQMRRHLLQGVARLALWGNTDALAYFLDNGFAELQAGLPPTRAALVDGLLRTLVELLAAVEVPVVFAFDNLERLISPLGRLDHEAAQSLFAGMAHVVDNIPGILFLVFAEGSLWTQCMTQAIDSFAADRLLQGLRLRQYGHVAQVDLDAPTRAQLESLVARRMSPLLQRIPGAAELPSLFPFDSADLERIANPNDVLRRMLQRLRDRFDELVLGAIPSGLGPATTPEVLPHRSIATRSQLQLEREVLLPRWELLAQRAGDRLASSPRTALAGELHNGLAKWLELFIGPELAVHGWKLLRVDTGVTFGNQPNYGVLTVPHWSGAAGGATKRVALGIILGQGPGASKDMEVKLSVFAKKPWPADQLVVLWPGGDPEFGPESLPSKTRQVWEERHGKLPICLRGVGYEDLQWLLGFTQWHNAVNELQEPDWPPDAVSRFVHSRTAPLVELFLPAPVATEEAEG